MKTRTRIILWLILLLVGVQWIADPFDEGDQKHDSSLTAAQGDPEENEPDESHHLGLVQMEDDDIILSLDVPQEGPDLFGWILPSPDSPDLPNLALISRIPRAPPTA